MPSMEFRLPDIGEGLAEVEVVRWLVAEGESVEENQPVAEVESDKAVVSMPAPASGRISRLCVNEGERIKVGSVLLVVDLPDGGEPATGPGAEAAPSEEARSTSGLEAAPAVARMEPQASPAVRRLARQLGVALQTVTGTGPRGRITEQDIRREAESAAEIPSVEPSPMVARESETAPGPIETLPYRGLRRRIGEAMEYSARTIPHVTGFHELDAASLVRLYSTLKAEAEREGIRLTYLPFVVKATVHALQQHPALNASLDEEAQVIQLKKFINVGIATAAPDGLLVPVIRAADRLDIRSIAREIARLSAAAQKGQLTPGDQQHGTFTITNVGAARGWLNTSLIRHPEVAILGIGRIDERPVVREGRLAVGRIMPVALTFDHRVIDGDTALAFMLTLRRYLENPELLLVGQTGW